jgi:hypothetical protein
MDNNRQKWLDSLVEGDEVAIETGAYGFREYAIVKIDRITPTRIFKIYNTSFDKNGEERGNRDRWTATKSIEPVTEKILNSIQRKNLLRQVNEIDFSKLTIEQLESIVETVKKGN